MGEEDFLQQLQAESDSLKSQNNQLNTALSTSAYQGQEDANLIQYQIDTGEQLAKIEHFLKGEYIKTDKEGNEFWATPTKKIKKDDDWIEVKDDSLIVFNEYGVNSVLSILGNYLDKNTILSFYDEMRINEILADLGDKLTDFIFENYEIMGMDTEFKKTRYPLIVVNILHTVESVYRRALRGKTMEDLNSSKIFTQMDNLGVSKTSMPMKKKFNPFKPGTW